MSFDIHALQALVAQHGPVVRVVLAEVAGSAPREAGAAVVVWARGQDGTIGGGALEYEAVGRARAMLASATPLRLDRVPLGPGLGQCCGGAVTLVSERWDAEQLAALGEPPVIARPVAGRAAGQDAATGAAPPLAVRKLIAAARGGNAPSARLVQGWVIEPVARPTRRIWIWGAGHVGRALVTVLTPLPDVAITWIDTAADRFPPVPAGVTARIAPNPGDLVAEAPLDAEHLILTYSHALDLDLCHRLLVHGFKGAGLIGSATKWARFRNRLASLGHADASIMRIACPIGDPALGKHPQAIAVGVAAALLTPRHATSATRERTG
ncbi:xanthine dehydrogenase accessory protein XdhC [Plastorhodobacter daqingensis]|uniref:Xanthine dehydrogenase accessory protein XdhC n=1 Tax=Plastorhodobacter daqingensis TaxID=1387281 RepID=A0ABW2UKW8_9RHOB